MTEQFPPSSGISERGISERELSGEERLAAILTEARRAPLPSSPPFERSDVQREEKRRIQVQRLAQLIQRAPGQVTRERNLRKRWFAGVATFAAAAAAFLFVSTRTAQPELATLDSFGKSAVVRISDGLKSDAPSVAPTEPSPDAALSRDAVKIEQVIGKVVATRADGRDEVLSAGMLLGSGDRVSTTAEAYATLGLEAGIRVDLASATTVAVASRQEVALRVGRVDVNVPKLPGVARRLSVNTPDTTVVVRGTIFSVEFSAADARPETVVGVTRGAVSVFHDGKESRIGAGQLWTSTKPLERESLLAEEPGDPDTGSSKVHRRVGPTASEARKRRGVSPETPEANEVEEETTSSSLSRQNAIFERGLRARDQGDAKRAVYWFDQLLRRYPTSPLAESAERERAAARARLRKD